MKFRILLFSTLAFSSISLHAAPTVEFDTKKFDCGVIIKGKQDKLEAVFNVKNTGDEPLKLLKVKPSCGCTVVKYDSIIQPGASTAIKSTVNIKGRKGSLSKGVRVTSNAQNDSIVRLLIKARIIEPLSSSLSFIDMTGNNENKNTSITLSTPKEDLKVTKVIFKPKSGKPIKAAFTFTPTDSTDADGLSLFTLDIEPVKMQKVTEGELVISTNHPERKEMKLRAKSGK